MGNTGSNLIIIGENDSHSDSLSEKMSRMPIKFQEGDNDLGEDECEALGLAGNYHVLMLRRKEGILAFNNRFKKALTAAFKAGIDPMDGGIITFSAVGIEATYEKMREELPDRGYVLKYNEITQNFEISSGKFVVEESMRKIQQERAAQMQKMMGGIQGMGGMPGMPPGMPRKR